MRFDFPFVRLFGVREFCYYPYDDMLYLWGKLLTTNQLYHICMECTRSRTRVEVVNISDDIFHDF
jgi:hypothetical protein